MILPITAKLHNARTFGNEMETPRVMKDEEFEAYYAKKEAIEKQYTEKEFSHAKTSAAITAASLATFVGISIGSGLTGINQTKTTDKALNALSTQMQRSDTKKDSFEVRDVNHDETPEIILTRKDGTKVAIDILTGNVLKQKTQTSFKIEE